jgi:hypothetical protein
VKLSVLFFYRRIFVVDKNWRSARNLIFVSMITLVALWTIGYTVTLMFMCKGRFEILFTDLMATMAYCMNILIVGYSYAVSDFILDAIIILLPLPFVSMRAHHSEDVSLKHVDLEIAPTIHNQTGGDGRLSPRHPRIGRLACSNAVDDLVD